MTAAIRGAIAALVLASCGGAGAVPRGDGRVEDFAMTFATYVCDNPAAARAMLLSYEEFSALAPRAGVTNPGARLTSTAPDPREYDGDADYLIRSLCGDLSRHAGVVGAVAVPAGDPGKDAQLGLEAAHVKFVIEKSGAPTTPGHPLLFLRTPRGWRFAWVED